jgi:hypothetical protein
MVLCLNFWERCFPCSDRTIFLHISSSRYVFWNSRHIVFSSKGRIFSLAYILLILPFGKAEGIWVKERLWNPQGPNPCDLCLWGSHPLHSNVCQRTLRLWETSMRNFARVQDPSGGTNYLLLLDGVAPSTRVGVTWKPSKFCEGGKNFIEAGDCLLCVKIYP